MTSGNSQSVHQHQMVPIRVTYEDRLVSILDRDSTLGHQTPVEVGKDWHERNPGFSTKQKPGRGDVVATPIDRRRLPCRRRAVAEQLELRRAIRARMMQPGHLDLRAHYRVQPLLLGTAVLGARGKVESEPLVEGDARRAARYHDRRMVDPEARIGATRCLPHLGCPAW